MPEIKWTDEQLNAIDAHGGTVLVSAAAGSGKTAVLVERVIKMITDEKNPCSVDELLIVTFTKAAASQMKDKISRAISDMIKSCSDMKKRSYLLKQQMLLKCAKVSTIDSFCSDIVKQNIQALPIDSNYRLIDEDSMRVIKDEAYENVAERFYEEADKSFLILADMFTKSNDDKLLKDLVMSLYDFAISYKNPKKWIEEIDAKFCNDKTDFTNGYAKTVFNNFKDDVLYFKELALRALDIARCDDLTDSKYGVTVRSDIEFFDSILALMNEDFTEENWDNLQSSAIKPRFERIKTITAANQNDISKAVKAIRDTYKDMYTKKSVSPMGVMSFDHKDDVEKLTPIMKALSRFTLAFFDEFYLIKNEKNCVDFSDILHMALRLLTDENGKTELAEEYASQFKEILIDEYQDTNEAQDVLFNAISRDGKNLFFVGDVKQSIYGFRKAMPQIFLEKRKTFSDFERTNPIYPATISLDMNFRSRKEVTNFVNFIFTQIMGDAKGAGEIDYNERETLKAGAKYEESNNMQAEIHLLEKECFEDEDSSEVQAKHIAGEIKKLTVDGKIKYGDIAVLLRTNKSMPTFVRILNEMGVPARSDQSENLFETEEVTNVLSLIKVIDNPARDVEILACMMSPMFAFTAEELAEIRIETRSGSFYNAVVKASSNGNKKAEGFLSTLASFRLVAQTVTPGELVRHILNETGYKSIVSSLPGGERCVENLDIFRAFAESFSKENDVGLSGFVRQIEKTEKISQAKSASDSKGSENSVVVMSIHRSKGLEFPVCFLAEAEKDFSKRDLKDDLLAHPQAGVGIVGIDTKKMIKYQTLSRTAIKIEKEMTNMSEEIRVLYVALTRAKEKLFIVATADTKKEITAAAIRANGKKVSAVAVRHSSNYLDWILTSCIRHPDAVWMRTVAGPLSDEKISSDFPLEIKKIEVLEDISDKESAVIKNDSADDEFIEKLKERINYVYQYSALSDTLAKRGASTAFKQTINREFFASDRPAFLNKTALTAAGRGTAMHTFMQFSDYANSKVNLENEIENLTDKGYLDSVQAKSLERNKLKAFFESDLFKRIEKSDRVYREKKFIIAMSPCVFDENLGDEFKDEKVVVQGILDCAFEEDGQIVIVDYKTDRVTNEDELRKRYSSQLKIYEHAVRECLGKSVKETLLYSFKLDTTVKI